MTEQQTAAMRQALEALVSSTGELHLRLASPTDMQLIKNHKAITSLREALAEQPAQTDWEAVAADQAMTIALLKAEQPAEQQEPVAWMWKDGTITSDPDRADGTWTPLYTSPQPSKPWAGLDQHDLDVLFLNEDGVRFARYIEAKLKEKNT